MRRIAKFIEAWIGPQDPLTVEQALQGWIPVESSMIARVRFTTHLEVEFTNGSTYEYQAPLEIFEDMLKADSVGRYLNQHVKGTFAFRQVKPAWQS